jgi:hypothetical protein
MGRDGNGREVLEKAEDVKVKVYQRPGNDTMISSLVDCPYNCGKHGNECRASNITPVLHKDKAYCPYSFDIPHALERSNRK